MLKQTYTRPDLADNRQRIVLSHHFKGRFWIRQARCQIFLKFPIGYKFNVEIMREMQFLLPDLPYSKLLTYK